MFSISDIQIGQGVIGISPIVGRDGDYADDLRALIHWQPDIVLSLVELHEFKSVGAQDFPDDLAEQDIKWLHFPIKDYACPGAEEDALWIAIGAILQTALAQNTRVCIHCRGGCGRSGMIALRAMIDAGERAEEALERLRSCMACAVETDEQMAWATSGLIKNVEG